MHTINLGQYFFSCLILNGVGSSELHICYPLHYTCDHERFCIPYKERVTNLKEDFSNDSIISVEVLAYSSACVCMLWHLVEFNKGGELFIDIVEIYIHLLHQLKQMMAPQANSSGLSRKQSFSVMDIEVTGIISSARSSDSVAMSCIFCINALGLSPGCRPLCLLSLPPPQMRLSK